MVIGGWLVALVALTLLSQLLGTRYSDTFSLPGTESTRALDLLTRAFPSQAGESDRVVWHVTSGTVDDPAVRDRMTAALDRIGRSAHVAGVGSPYTSPQGGTQISADRRIAYATVSFDVAGPDLPVSALQGMIDAGSGARTDGLEVEFGGQGMARLAQQVGGVGEIVGVLAAALVLLLAFGSLLAMLLPLGVALVALGTATAAVGLLTRALDIATFAPTLGTLIGLGVGIDYALFIVTRHRNGIKAGATPQEAARTALNTSGRAVLFAGGTVCIALLGQLVARVSFLNGVAIAASITVLFTVAASVTLLPALLGLLGERVLSRRERRRPAEHGPGLSDASGQPHASGGWARWSRFVGRHPWPLAAVAVALIAALSVPFFAIRLGTSDQGDDPSTTTTRKAYDLLADGFGAGFNGSLVLVAQLRSGADRTAFDALARRVGTMPGVVTAGPVRANQAGDVAIVSVVPTTSPQDRATSELIRTLRSDVVPAAERGSTLRVDVGGATAINDDFSTVLAGKLPLFVAVIVGLAFLLLLVAFRSLLVPLTAAVMNLLAAGASFGLVVGVFQWGWGARLLDIGAGPIEPFVPVMMLAILFGLSMDYQVFLVSRMHEEWVHTGSNRRAVTVGQAQTGRVITAAASIMILVFGAFVPGARRVIAEFGIGLAGAVLVDAFILRTLLVPALMHLFGRANWWLPGWLDRILPHLAVEPPDDPPGGDGPDAHDLVGAAAP
jgi:RND superfamily putative drug exporter